MRYIQKISRTLVLTAITIPVMAGNNLSGTAIVNGDGNTVVEPLPSNWFVINGNGNYNYSSPNGVVNGNNNSVVDQGIPGVSPVSTSTDRMNIIGNSNYGKAGNTHSVIGDNNRVTGGWNDNQTTTIGSGNSISNANVTAITGNNNTISGNNGTIIGNDNNVSGNAVAIGNGNTASSSGVAIGGSNASNGGIAIGSGSNASKADEVNFGDRNITGIKEGVAGTDFVNVDQLNNKASETLNNANNYTDDQFHDAKNVANNYTDQKIYEFLNDSVVDNALAQSNNYALARFNQLNKKSDRLQKDLYGGISSAIAISSIPVKLNKRVSFGTGVGSYKNEMALALGVKVGVTRNLALGTSFTYDTRSNSGVTFSLAYGWW